VGIALSLFEYAVEQKTFEIGGVKVGGEPGITPTVMIGSIFYKGHGIVEDPKGGLFDEKRAETLVKRVEEQADLTGLPGMVDIVVENAVAAGRYLDFVAGVTEMPLVLDIPAEDIQVEVLQYASDSGLLDRAVLNSLTSHSGSSVYEKIKEVGCTSAILLLYSTGTLLSSDKSCLLDEILPRAKEAGVENILVDTSVIDIPSLGLASKAVHRIKDQYGFPAGCGAHNAISSWKRLKEKYRRSAVLSAVAVANSLPTALGADFVIYGPIDIADDIFPAVALVDAAYSQIQIEKRVRPGRDHPRYRIG
jgi:tetrahydromethanopterin S-methyltransferase subunit H